METQLLLSLEILVTVKEGKVGELEPEPWFMVQNCLQKKGLQLAEKRAHHTMDTPRIRSQNAQSTSDNHSPASSSCPQLASSQRKI